MNDAIDQYYADKNKWPADLAALASEGYLREIPTDPMTKSKDTWTTTQAEPDANNPASQVGILRGEERLGPHCTRRHALLGLVNSEVGGMGLEA